MKFSDRVYEILTKVPRGRVTTYKAITEKMGTKAYQAVGQALKKNPNAPVIPCHRVVRNDGKIGGFMGKIDGKSVKMKIDLLKSEGVVVVNGKVVDFEKIVY
jgi:methylated-DNA-[protein]-cysteine S-methyltransferase